MASKKRKEQLNNARNSKKQRLYSINELSEWQNQLKNKQGQTRSEQENKLLLQEIFYYLIKGKSLTECINLLEEIHGGSRKYYFDIWDYWIQFRSSNINESRQPRGRIQSEINEIVQQWDVEHEDMLAEYIFENTIKNPTGFSVPDLIAYYKTNCNLEISNDHMQKILRYYKCEFDNDTKVYYGLITEDRKKEFERFLYQYSHALQLCNQQTHYRIATDETWINLMTCQKESWLHNCGNDTECLLNGICHKILKFNDNEICKATVAKKNIGRRYVILHAMSSEQLMVDNDDDEKKHVSILLQDQLNFEQDIANAELIFEAKNDHKGDYHLQMNDEIYLQWAEHRLLPAHNAINPNKIPIIIPDQAPYHMSRLAFPHSGSTKSTIVTYYDIHNINNIKIRRYRNGGNELLQFKRHEFLIRPPKGPSKEELLLYLYEKLKRDNPIALEPEFAKLIRNHGGVVLFTVPNNPQDQPFEFCNAYVKYHCKKTVKRGRTMEELFTNILEGFYGGYTKANRYHRPIDSVMIEGWFEKCHANMDKEIVEILGINDKNIYNLWDEQSPYRLGQPYLKRPWTIKTLNKWKTLFDIVLD